MRCDHRFKLVGYRDREPEGDKDPNLLDAVLVCLKCTRPHLIGVTEMPPAPIIQPAPESLSVTFEGEEPPDE